MVWLFNRQIRFKLNIQIQTQGTRHMFGKVDRRHTSQRQTQLIFEALGAHAEHMFEWAMQTGLGLSPWADLFHPKFKPNTSFI